ncbi:T9SS type A sorting domain-containing protein [Rhodocytophaga rosea]|uniref:T9SS type A sorting domain-containing protein n=1 Tax=Rhodocytophaga rosea TaxID=2704465 RepID=A0A6C0GDF6_9BACT|nr:T9SS type A sorting domain-containing protein [Rhodocytophaga rosea]QHT65833.1 T9SS type A sorting domain-containing protein [Rhodocytophaga rosea]
MNKRILLIYYRKVQEQFAKCKNRLERRLLKGTFKTLPTHKRNGLLQRINRLQCQLSRFQQQLSLISVGSAFVTGLATSTETLAQTGAATAGNPIQVNSFTTNNQVNAAIAVDPDGDFVVVWQGNSQIANSGYDIYMRRYDAAGKPLDPDGKLVNTGYTTGNQVNPAVAMDADGDFVITWQSEGQDGSLNGIYAQRYTAAGVAQLPVIQANNLTTGEQTNPAIAMFRNGDFVLAWEGLDASGTGIYLRRYNAAGAAQTANEVVVNTTTAGNQIAPAISMDDTGNFVIAWQSSDGAGDGIFAKRYNAAGTAQSGDLPVNTTTAGSQREPSVAVTTGDTAGSSIFMITWVSTNQDGAGEGVFARRFVNNTGGSEFPVNTYTTSDQSRPVVATDEGGIFVIIWQSIGQDGSEEGIYTRRYTRTGNAIDANEFLVNAFTTGKQTKAAVATDAAGNFIIAYSSYGQLSPTSNEDVFAQRYTLSTSDQRISAGNTSGVIAAMDASGDYVLIWQSSGREGDAAGEANIYAQRYNAAGIAQGSEFRINSIITGSQTNSSVAMDQNGNFVVVWQSGNQLWGKRYNASGVVQGTEFNIGPSAVFPDSPEVAMDADGDFVVVWVGDDRIWGKRYNVSGIAQGGEFAIDEPDGFNTGNPAVAMDQDGDFVVAWQENPADYNVYQGLYARRYNRLGVAQGNQFTVDSSNSTRGVKRRPSAAMDAVGNFVIVWDSDFEDTNGASGYDIFRARFSANGTRLDNPANNIAIKINTWTGVNRNNLFSRVFMDAVGNFTVVWSSESDTEPNPLDGSCNSAIARRYNSNGDALSSEFRVNSYTKGDQDKPALAMNMAGNFVIAWRSGGDCGNGDVNAQQGIYSRLFLLPTNLTLTAAAVPENQTGAAVGIFATSDATAGDTHAYTFATAADNTDDDNASFIIENGQLKLKANIAFNFEVKSTYRIRIRSTDASGLYIEKAFVITVSDDNDAPTNITLSAASVMENKPVKTSVGNLTTIDADAGNTHTYSLVDGTGSTDNGSFVIESNQLQTNVLFNFEAKSSYSIRLRTTDAAGLFFEKVFIITIVNINDAPTLNPISDQPLAQNVPLQTVTLSGISSGGEPGQTITITHQILPGGNQNLISNVNIMYTSPATTGSLQFKPNANQIGEVTIRITVKDNGGIDFLTRDIKIIGAPSVPVNLTAIANPLKPESEIILSWNDSESETAYFIEVSKGDESAFVELGSVGENSTTYTHKDITDPGGTKFFYRIRAFNNVYSAYSQVVGVVTAASIVTGLETGSEKERFSVYPNPTIEYIVIDHTKLNLSGIMGGNIEIYNAQGKSVWSGEWERGKEGQTIQVAHLPDGMYHLILTAGDRKFTQKIVKQ